MPDGSPKPPRKEATNLETILCIDIFPVVLTIGAFWVGQTLQKKWKSPLLNPTLVGAVLTIGVLLLTGLDTAAYRAGTAKLSWLMTPATVALAIPMYEQFQVLKRDLRAIAVGVTAGAVSCMAMVLGLGLLFGLEEAMIFSLLPKSVTTAIGVPLSQMAGGMEGVTTAAIIVTGIIANMMGPSLCKVMGIRDPLAQGVAFGTAGHVMGTARANELSPLTGAVSTLSLVTAGLLTALILPLMLPLL